MPSDRYRVTTHNVEGEFVTDAIMGPNSLAIEISYLPVGWKLTVVRIEDGEVTKGNG